MSKLDLLLKPNPTNQNYRCSSYYLDTVGLVYQHYWFGDYCKAIRDPHLQEPCAECIFFAENIIEGVKCLD